MSNRDYWEGSDIYQYPNSDVLRNIQNITDKKILELFEKNVSEIRYQEIVGIIQSLSINLSLWKKIHQIFFQDVYEWAGEIRTVRITRGSTVFCYPEYIQKNADKVFLELNSENFLVNQPKLFFCQRLACYFCELNMVHPFREGNGRTQKILFDEIARRVGYQINWLLLNEEEHLSAVIAGCDQDYHPMTQVFERIITIFGEARYV